jgi:hypothetical protein
MVLICLICHRGWHGKIRYALRTSDLKTTKRTRGPDFRLKDSKARDRSARVSKRQPWTSSRAIIEFKENGPALWSLTSLSLELWGFGTAWMGELYIPGSKSGPKDSENRPAAISMSRWLLIKTASASVFGGRSEKSQVVG